MYNDLLEKNKNYIKNIVVLRDYSAEVTHITNLLNSQYIVTLTWLRHTGKTWLIRNLLEKTQTFNDCFYYNAELDTLQSIKNKDEFIILFDLYVRIYWVPKIIILQNMNNIEWIKELILQLYKTKKYKIILVWNNIQIQWVWNIELFPLWLSENKEKNSRWWLPAVRVIPQKNYKDSLLVSLKNDILLTDIINAYNIKNVLLYNTVLAFLANYHEYSSVREIHRSLWESNIEISHLTLIEYLSSATNTKLISKCFRYDMKTEKEISSKVHYYFWDVWIRKTLTITEINPSRNLLYLEFLLKWYSVYGWINWKFVFDFFATKWNTSFCVHFEDSSDKTEIRKTARKLAKIEYPVQKFVIVENKEKIDWMRKFEEQGVKIVELWELVKFI